MSTTKLSPSAQQVLEAFKEHGPMTDQMLVERTGIDMRTASPRRRGLADKGLLEAVGKAPTRSGRMAQLWAVVPPDRVEEAREQAGQRDPRRRPVTAYKLKDKVRIVQQLLDDPEVNEAVHKMNGKAYARVRARSRDRAGQREHERRELNKLLKEQQRDPSGLVDFLKAKRNLLNVEEAMRGTSEFLKEEMRFREETGALRIPMQFWPEVVDLLEDLESLATDARNNIDNVLGRLGDDIIEGEAVVLEELELPVGDADIVG